MHYILMIKEKIVDPVLNIVANTNIPVLKTLYRANEEVSKILQLRKNISSLSEDIYKLNILTLNNLAANLHNISLLQNKNDILFNLQDLVTKILQNISKKENIHIDEDIIQNILKSQVLQEDIDIQYLLQKDLEDASLYFTQFNKLVNYYAHNYFKTSLVRHKKLVKVNQEELTNQNLSEIYNIETLVYSKEIAGKEDSTGIVIKNNSKAISAAKDIETNQIIAFICAYPITDAFYKKLISGSFNDTNITSDDIQKYEQEGTYKLYISSFCVHPRYTRSSAFSIVYKSFLEIIQDLAYKNIFITEILADTATKKGALLCRSLGMKKHLDTDHNTVLYKINISETNISKIFSKNKEVLQMYGDLLKRV